MVDESINSITYEKTNSDVSIVIPVYKEEKFIENTINGLLNSFRSKKVNFEIIAIVDVVKEDRSIEIISKMINENKEIILIRREGKKGIASAIIKGIEKASKKFTFIIMADNSEKSDDLLKMFLKIQEGYDMVVGNRFLPGVKVEGYTRKKYFMNRICNKAIRILFKISTKDVTNATKIYRTDILKKINLTSKGFEIFAEIPLKVFINGYRNFAEIPLSHFAREESFSNLNIRKEGPRYFKIVMKCFFENLKK